MTLKRFGVSLEQELLEDLDRLAEKQRFPNRSQAIRFLIKKNKVEEQWDANAIVLGSIVVVYDHKQKDLHKQVTTIQHEYHCLILAGQHVHIDDHNCLQVFAVKGKAERLNNLANKLKSIKGIKHADLVKTGLE
jgi:CopG family transcriptional regulator, nickel-responsive regulator